LEIKRNEYQAAAAVQGRALFEPESEFWRQAAPRRFGVRVETSEGSFLIEVDRELAPIGADRFFQLVGAGFYDDSRFFRIREGYIAQFGVAGDPRVSALWRERTIPDEAKGTVLATNVRGTLAFAMTGPDSRTTQLYINLADNRHLDAQGFAPIGEVVEGMEVVDRLYAGYDEGAGGGMRGGRQGRMFAEGNAQLDVEFPQLSRLVRASIE
jgi:homoserine O-acetyltransferase